MGCIARFMKTSRKVGIGLAVVVVIVACFFGPRWYTTLKIRSGVRAQLLQRLPHTTHLLGQNRELQRVSIVRSRWSEDGHRCEVIFQLHYQPQALTESGCVLTRDEWGTYRGDWSYSSNRVTLAIN